MAGSHVTFETFWIRYCESCFYVRNVDACVWCLVQSSMAAPVRSPESTKLIRSSTSSSSRSRDAGTDETCLVPSQFRAKSKGDNPSLESKTVATSVSSAPVATATPMAVDSRRLLKKGKAVLISRNWFSLKLQVCHYLEPALACC
jgi:hypothetical protein